MNPSWTVVVPTLGRPSLDDLLRSLAAQEHQPAEVLVVDDRAPGAAGPLEALDVGTHPRARALRGRGLGPAHARNVGWRACCTEWVVFVDDDVLVPPRWSCALVADLAVDDVVGGSQAVVEVPLPTDRRPTDWERGTAALATGRWITAEMAYRRSVLERVGGFDERFPRAFREDADLALRVQRAGARLAQGRRRVVHPVRPADRWVSLRRQRGNADDALMRRLHGGGWYRGADARGGALPWHAATVVAACGSLVAAMAGRRRTVAVLGAAWAALTTRFAWSRIAPGPRTGEEVLAMTATSLAIPFAAVRHRLAGEVRHRSAPPWPAVPTPDGARVRAVLLDRDGTLVHDVPYNGDPDLVRVVAGAGAALDRLRHEGFRLGVVTNQSGVARGLLTRDQVTAVNGRVEELLGPFDTWQVCPHAPDDGCRCRKPAPGLVLGAAAELGVRPDEVVVVGDIGADVLAAEAAGATGVLVPTASTLPDEVDAARYRAPTLGEAVDLVLALAAGAVPGTAAPQPAPQGAPS